MILGVDPGAHGALAFLDDDGKLAEVLDMPAAEIKVGKRKSLRVAPAAVAIALALHDIDEAFVEAVGAMPGQGTASMFAFGRAAGIIDGILAAQSTRVTYVTPQAWKRWHHLPAEKGNARVRAMQLWPASADLFVRVKDDGRAEAALIALYGLQARERKAA